MDVFWFVFFWFLIVVLIFAWPTWPYAGWGYTPSAVAFSIALVLLLLFWLGFLVVWSPWGVYG